MNERKIFQGLVLGAVGGMAMAMWSMIALAATGDGFFSPVNLIAHSVWRDGPLDGGFNGGAFALGIVIHMMVSMMIGVMIAILAGRSATSKGSAVAVAVVVPMAAWAGQLVAWDIIDSDARSQFTPWVLFVGHLMFAMVAVAWALFGHSEGATASNAGHAHTHAHA